jgi:hypothetical protein
MFYKFIFAALIVQRLKLAATPSRSSETIASFINSSHHGSGLYALVHISMFTFGSKPATRFKSRERNESVF